MNTRLSAEQLDEIRERDYESEDDIRSVSEDRRALLAHIDSAVTDGWQPIETAPKDGRSVLLATESGFRAEGYLDCALGRHRMAHNHEEPLSPFTHWMPFPPPPFKPSAIGSEG